MTKKIKLPNKDELRKMLFTKIYGEWRGGTCRDYVAGWNLHCSLFDAILDQAVKEFSEVQLEFFCVVTVNLIAQNQPPFLHSFLYEIMAEILYKIVSDKKVAQKLRKKFLRVGGLS